MAMRCHSSAKRVFGSQKINMSQNSVGSKTPPQQWPRRNAMDDLTRLWTAVEDAMEKNDADKKEFAGENRLSYIASDMTAVPGQW
jgi:hypothetical protein